MLVEAQKLTQLTFDAIALYRGFNILFGDGDTESGMIGLIGRRKQRHLGGTRPGRLVKHRFKIGWRQQA